MIGVDEGDGDAEARRPRSGLFADAWSPILVGLAVALIGMLGWSVCEAIAGRLGGGSTRRVMDGLTVGLVTLQAGYFVAALPLMRRVGLGCVDELRPVVDLGHHDFRQVRARFERRGRPGLGIAVLAGALVTIVLQEIQLSRFSGWLAAPDWALGELWMVLAAWSAWSLGFSTAGLLLADALALSRLGRDHVAVDLLRTDRLAPFARFGLQLSAVAVGVMMLWAAGLVVVFSVIGVDLAETYSTAGITVMGFYVVIAVASFLVPQLGIRARIRQQKRAMAERLANLLPQADQAVHEAGSSPERLAALLSVREKVQGAPEWPTGEHTRLRLVVYLTLPLLSWSAAALVETLISRWIG